MDPSPTTDFDAPSAPSPDDRRVSRFNVLQVAVWTILALAILPSCGAFLYDEAYFYHQAYRVFREGVFPVVGPFISGTFFPTAFTPGGGFFLAIAPAFLVGSHPSWGTAWLILLSSAGILFLDRTLKRIGEAPALRFFAVFFLTWSVWHAYLVDRIWNVHLYWGASLALLAVSLRVVDFARAGLAVPFGWSLGFGVLAGLILQVHLGGMLAVALCGGLVLFRGGRAAFRPRNLAWVLGGLVLMYAPYLVSELQSGWSNSIAMKQGRAEVGKLNRGALIRALKSPLVYTTHLKTASFDVKEALGSLTVAMRLLGSVVALLVFLRGLRERHWLRGLALGSFALVPIYMVAIRRDYYDHYVASVVPFYVLAQALGTWSLYRKARTRRWAWAHAGLFAVVATGLWVGEYRERYPEYRISRRMEEARALLASPTPPKIVDTGQATEAFIAWVLARDVLGAGQVGGAEGGARPRFWLQSAQAVCSIELGEPRGPRDAWLFPGSFFSCSE